jgi:hypothetical protein
MKKKNSLILPAVLVLFFLIAIFTILGPSEKTLGGNIRIVLLHGAWVWTGIVGFTVAGLTGLAALLTGRSSLHRLSKALGISSLFYWLTYLPMSLVVMQMNWNGLYLDEPRFRIPLIFGITGLAIQIGLHLFDRPALTSTVNAIFAVALIYNLNHISNVLHPENPLFGSNAVSLQTSFIELLLLSAASDALLTLWLYRRDQAAPAAKQGKIC